MKIIDSHCDALLKLWEDESRSFVNDESIQVNYERMIKGNIHVQCFALFAEPYLKNDEKFHAIMKQVQLFKQHILTQPNVKHIKNWSDLFTLEENEIGAILTLEGMEAVGNDLDRLTLLFEQGVISVGITWNEANLCADGVLEKRGAGLSELGEQVVKMNNDNDVLTDVSHLSERGFWECIEQSDFIWASHSNAKAIRNHPRNLSDEQIEALIKQKGLIGLAFYPLFLCDRDEATITDIIKHIEHICSLGGKDYICFGSDFDGIRTTVNNFEHAGKYQIFIEELLKHYSEQDVIGFSHENFLRKIRHSFIKNE